MYTCCPICKTNFKVTEAQLQVAQGKVRCGSCKNVFNARQHIHYTSSKPAQATQPSAAKKIKENTQKTSSLTAEPSKNKLAQSNQPYQAKNDSNKPVTEIDKIFNALDTQLTKGTYIDIAKTDEPDIREAAFNDIFDDDEFSSTDDTPATVSPTTTSKNIFLKPPANSHSNHDEIDLNLYEEDSEKPVTPLSSDKIENTPVENQASMLTESHDDLALQKTLDNILDNNKLTRTNKQKQQHTFDFINLPDEADLSLEAEEQLAAVNTPLEMPATNKLVTKTDNDELHQAIDNIIKVNNSITTPYEENDADHFVIEVQNEPDVELVDENDIDKLFASTDNLKISDLKFSPNKIKPTEDKLPEYKPKNDADDTTASIAIQNDSSNSININISLDDANEYDPVKIEPNLNVEKSHALIENDFDDPAFEQQAKTFDPDDSDIIDLEKEFDNHDFDEEIVLSSEAEIDVVPHRLRDAVASFEQEPVSIKKRLFYSIAIILLTSLAGLQLVIFKSTAAANTFPVLQPLLVSMCQKLPCRYTGNHNRKQIKILNRDVRLHPKIKGALLISATIANQASYTQPYPTILLKFTDLTGATVAQRYFQPTEYLGQLNKPFALMPSKKPVQLNIEILDPGSEAINFQFFFL